MGRVKRPSRATVIELASGPLRLVVDPARGATIRAFDLMTAEGILPLMAAADGEDASASALFPMAPFANRARGNRLTIGDRQVAIRANTAEPLCLHGWAWQRRWKVIRQTATSCHLALTLCDHGMNLALDYVLKLWPDSLALTLSARNDGTEVTPTGLGFHPYFPRHANTQISFAADTLWPEGPDHLPTGGIDVPETEDFSMPRALPRSWRNQCYSGWTGTALIRQPSAGYDLELRATGTRALMVYLDPDLPRFALEPQSHVSGETHSGPDGLHPLAPGRAMSIGMHINQRRHDHKAGGAGTDDRT